MNTENFDTTTFCAAFCVAELASGNEDHSGLDGTTLHELPSTSSKSNCDDPLLATESSTDNFSDTETTDSGNSKKHTTTLPSKTNGGKKRCINSNMWKKNIAKERRNKGLEYINRMGKNIKPRVMKQPCKCRINCSEKLNEDERKCIFDNFWMLADYSRQSAFVGKCVKRLPKKRKTVFEDERESRRKSSLQYSLFLAGEETVPVTVCKTMFLNTLGISDMWVTTAIKKSDVFGVGILNPDQRGKHSNHNRVSEDVKKSVREHIGLLPQVESHYCEKTTKRVYLEQTLNISKMYRLYTEWMEENNKLVQATPRQYREIFDKEFNMSFFKPKKDECDTCYSYKIKENITQEDVEANESHLKNVEVTQQLKDADRERASYDNFFSVACFDLQRVMLIPFSEESVFYYKSKLSIFNFTMFDLGVKQGYSNIWNEQIAKQGANEIASCLYFYLEEMASKGKQEIALWSDNCAGQNNIRYLVAMFLHAARKFKINIDHSFLEQGHTQNENDSMHARIEKIKYGQEIFSPDQFVMLVKLAKVNGKTYRVKEMCQTDFYDFKYLINSFNNNWTRSTSNSEVNWNSIRKVRVEYGNPNMILFKYELTAPEYLSIDLTTTTFGRSGCSKPVMIDLPLAYKGPIPILRKQYDDLQYLCDKGKIPNLYLPFFRNLKFKKSDSDNDSD